MFHRTIATSFMLLASLSCYANTASLPSIAYCEIDELTAITACHDTGEPGKDASLDNVLEALQQQRLNTRNCAQQLTEIRQAVADCNARISSHNQMLENLNRNSSTPPWLFWKKWLPSVN